VGIYLRKAIHFGPFHINLSRHRVSYSVGGRGARLGRSAQGRTYVQAGRGELSYRKFQGDPEVLHSQNVPQTPDLR